MLKIVNFSLLDLNLKLLDSTLTTLFLIIHYNRFLSDEEIEAPSHGLKVGLPPKKIDYSM